MTYSIKTRLMAWGKRKGLIHLVSSLNLFSMSAHSHKVCAKSISSNYQAMMHAETPQTCNLKRLKYLWQVEEVTAVVRAWATGSRPPNSFSCCYGNCEERKTTEERKHLLRQHTLDTQSLLTCVFYQHNKQTT